VYEIGTYMYNGVLCIYILLQSRLWYGQNLMMAIMAETCCFDIDINFQEYTSFLSYELCYLLPSHIYNCIYVFCIYLRINSDLCHLHHNLIGFYNRDGKCLQRGTDWVFK
jgi:hypothetical protein